VQTSGELRRHASVGDDRDDGGCLVTQGDLGDRALEGRARLDRA